MDTIRHDESIVVFTHKGKETLLNLMELTLGNLVQIEFQNANT